MEKQSIWAATITGATKALGKRWMGTFTVVGAGWRHLNPLMTVFGFIYVCMYLFMAALGLHCCARAFSSFSELGLLFIAVHGLLIAVASLVAEHGL